MGLSASYSKEQISHRASGAFEICLLTSYRKSYRPKIIHEYVPTIKMPTNNLNRKWMRTNRKLVHSAKIRLWVMAWWKNLLNSNWKSIAQQTTTHPSVQAWRILDSHCYGIPVIFDGVAFHQMDQCAQSQYADAQQINDESGDRTANNGLRNIEKEQKHSILGQIHPTRFILVDRTEEHPQFLEPGDCQNEE